MNGNEVTLQKSRGKNPSRPVMRSIKFWGRNVAESIVIAVGTGLLMNLFLVVQMNSGFVSAFRDMLALYPYYLMLAGGFTVMMYVMAAFSNCYSLLVSMNVTRKMTAAGSVGSTGILTFCMILMMWAIWSLTPGEISEKSLLMMPLFAGILFAVVGIMLLVGVVIVKWGKIGAIIMIVIAAFGGGCIGAGISIMSEDIVATILKLANMDFRIVTVVGAVIYAAAGAFVMIATRKMEVRR